MSTSAGSNFEPIQAYGYYYKGDSTTLEKRNFTIDKIADDQVVVKVAGCGLCHTDISYLTGAVKPKHELPLILGHEISGVVVRAGAAHKNLLGQSVIVPAVLPCGECELCRCERDNICQNQKMPGNDFHGGFASHVVVPGRFMCPLPENLGDYRLSQMSVIADAVTTPYQSLKRSGLQKGDFAIVVGVGGIGLYMVQHAKSAGAKVLALDVNDKKLQLAKEQGADFVLNTMGLAEKDIKDQVRGLVKQNALPKFRWKIFETSGTQPGQSVAFSLLTFASVLGVVGFTMEKMSLRLSNVMAFDADIFGNWGCRPAYYADVVELVLKKKINVLSNIREFPLDSINEVVAQSLAHKLEQRAIFIP